jgi:hypothetical protein
MADVEPREFRETLIVFQNQPYRMVALVPENRGMRDELKAHLPDPNTLDGKIIHGDGTFVNNRSQ